MCDQCAAIPDEDRHLELFLRGCPVARETFPQTMDKVLQRVAKRLLPAYAEDVVQQMWLLLLRTGEGQFDPFRGNARRFLHGKMLNAARDVAAANAAPGTRTRRTPADPACGRVEWLATCTEAADPAELAVSHMAIQDMVQHADAHAGAGVGQALRVILAEDCTVTEAARTVGMQRLTLSRAMHRWIGSSWGAEQQRRLMRAHDSLDAGSTVARHAQPAA